MKTHTYLQEDDMVRQAVDALIKTLALPRRRRLDSVRRHRHWQDGLDKDRFFGQVFGAEEPAHEVTP